MSNVEKFKQAVLKKAIQGELTKQLSSDGNAIDIMRSNHKEQRLSFKKQDYPFIIPKNWQWVKISDISTFPNQKKIRSKDIASNTWVLDLEDISENTGLIEDHTPKHNKKVKSSKNIFHKNDVLYGKLRPYLNKVAVADKDGVCTTEIFVLHLLNGVLPHYLSLVLRSPYFVNKVNADTYGTKMPRVGTKQFASYGIPLPPLSEQKRIVNKVNICFLLTNKIQERRRLNARFTHNMKQSLIQVAMKGELTKQLSSDGNANDLLKQINKDKHKLIQNKQLRNYKKSSRTTNEDIPFTIPKNWQWVRISDISTFPDQKQVISKDIASNTWVLDLKDISENTGIIKYHIPKHDKSVKSNKNIFHKNDVLYGKLRPYLNKVVVADQDGVCTTEIFVIHLLGHIDSYYLSLVLRSPYFLNRVNMDTYGTKMPRVGTKQFANYYIPLPPLPEQKRIVSTLKSLYQTFFN